MTVSLKDGVLVDDTTSLSQRTGTVALRPASPTAITQTYATATAVTVATPPATTTATQTTPWGYASQAQADAITAYLTTLAQLLNNVIDSLQAAGIMA